MKKIIAMLLCMALCATMAITGTVAYLTDEEDAKNIFEVGNVDIEQYEKDRDGKEFEQNQHLFPKVQVENGDTLHETVNDNINGEVNLVNTDRYNNYIDKIVTVENKGKSEAYVRNIVAVPTGLPAGADAPWLEVTFLDAANGDNDDWKQCPVVKDVEIDGVLYDLYVFNYVGEVDGKLASKDSTMPTLLGFSMSSLVNFDEDYNNGAGAYYYPGDDGDIYLTITPDANSILVATQAVQAEGFADFEHAFKESFHGDISATNHPWYKAPIEPAAPAAGYVGATAYTWQQLVDATLVTVQEIEGKMYLNKIAPAVTELNITSDNIQSINTNAMTTDEKSSLALKKVTIGYGVNIGGSAFSGCPALEEVVISGGATFAYTGHFYACPNLKTVVLEEGITIIPQNCFYNCDALESIVIPSTVTSIGPSAFTWCDNLTSVSLPKALEEVTDLTSSNFKHTPVLNNNGFIYYE